MCLLLKAFVIVELENFLYIVLYISYLNARKHIVTCQSGNLVKNLTKGKDGKQQQQQQQINQVVGKISKVFLGKITIAILICSMCSYL